MLKRYMVINGKSKRKFNKEQTKSVNKGRYSNPKQDIKSNSNIELFTDVVYINIVEFLISIDRKVNYI